MLREKALEYYQQHDYNCSEAMLLAVGDAYAQPLSPQSARLMSGFGGGLGCGKTCGALLGGLAGLGHLLVASRAHASPGFKAHCAGVVDRFVRDLGDDQCLALREKWWQEGSGCARVVAMAADSLADYIEESGLAPGSEG